MRTFASIALLALLAGLVGCGGSGSDEPSEDATGLLVTNGATGVTAEAIVAIDTSDGKGMLSTTIGVGETLFVGMAAGGPAAVYYMRQSSTDPIRGGTYTLDPGEVIEVTWGN